MKRQKKRLCALLCTILLLNTLVLAFAQSALAVSYRQGDSGSAVTTIQTKLKRWGYFDGPVDGIYGSKTSKAVRSFQRKNGLTADGVAGKPAPAAGTPAGTWLCWRRSSQQRHAESPTTAR